jgi:hypothetical protein
MGAVFVPRTITGRPSRFVIVHVEMMFFARMNTRIAVTMERITNTDRIIIFVLSNLNEDCFFGSDMLFWFIFSLMDEDPAIVSAF